jgi:glycine/D-amino acid oxidase-like deaminating enzyme/nitrite reductase/ring-hydroxylating ferredoxin subunit
MKAEAQDRSENQSLWMNSVTMPVYPALKADEIADVCIVGGGIAGLTTAYRLLQEGKNVVLLEDGELGGGMTQLTTAHLANVLDFRFARLEYLHGTEGTRLAAESHAAAIDLIEHIVRTEQIDCSFERLSAYLYLGAEDGEDVIEQEHEAAKRIHVDAEQVERAPLPFDTGICIRYAHQAQFHPLQYLHGLAQAVTRAGGRIYTHTHADRIVGAIPCTVETALGRVSAKSIVVATNAPINDLVTVHTKQSAYMTYVLVARIPKGSVEKALYWDTEDPYHYVRTQTPVLETETHDWLIVGGEDHRTGQEPDTEERFRRLRAWALSHFPMIVDFEFTWSGQVMASFDGLGFIGRNPLDNPNVYIVSGDSGSGMTHGTLAALLITDLICDRENPWTELYDPSRKTLRAAGTYTTEAVTTMLQYGDWLTGSEVDSIQDILPCSGATIRQGLTKVAVYRDEVGGYHALSAVCPHLGGIVHWNASDKTWDCPCHGSRFTRYGEPINGPANTPLAVHELPKAGATHRG